MRQVTDMESTIATPAATPTVGSIAAWTLVTDTVLADVIKVTAKTITIRPRVSTRKELRRIETESGYPIIWMATESLVLAPTRTVRLRKDGSYRISGSSNRMRFYDSDPGQKTDYRM